MLYNPSHMETLVMNLLLTLLLSSGLLLTLSPVCASQDYITHSSDEEKFDTPEEELIALTSSATRRASFNAAARTQSGSQSVPNSLNGISASLFTSSSITPSRRRAGPMTPVFQDNYEREEKDFCSMNTFAPSNARITPLMPESPHHSVRASSSNERIIESSRSYHASGSTSRTAISPELRQSTPISPINNYDSVSSYSDVSIPSVFGRSISRQNVQSPRYSQVISPVVAFHNRINTPTQHHQIRAPFNSPETNQQQGDAIPEIQLDNSSLN